MTDNSKPEEKRKELLGKIATFLVVVCISLVGLEIVKDAQEEMAKIPPGTPIEPTIHLPYTILFDVVLIGIAAGLLRWLYFKERK